MTNMTDFPSTVENESTNISSTEVKERVRKSNKTKPATSFQCEWCSKNYLLPQALSHHRKTKHVKNYNQAVKKRIKAKQDAQDGLEDNVYSSEGVPKEDEKDKETSKDVYFDMSGEEKTTPEEIEEELRNLDIYFDSLGQKRSSLVSHPIVKILRGLSKKSYFQFGSVIINDVFAEFLVEVAKGCSKSKFGKVLKLTLLFADCIERQFEANIKEYCSNFGPLEVPTVANNFIFEYMKKNAFDCSREETVDFVYKICHWLFIKDYTDISLKRTEDAVKGAN